MKLSIKLSGQLAFLTVGAADSRGGRYAQASDHFAPSATHFLRISISRDFKCLLLSVGGMRSSSSSDVIRRINSLLSKLPGTIAARPLRSAVADASRSSRRSTCRADESGP